MCHSEVYLHKKSVRTNLIKLRQLSLAEAKNKLSPGLAVGHYGKIKAREDALVPFLTHNVTNQIQI